MYETSSQFRSSTNEWMDLGFVIGGKTINISDVGTNWGSSSSLEMITLQDFVPAIDASSLERFYFSKNISFYSAPIQQFSRGSVEIYEYNEGLLDGLSLAQEFDWTYAGGPSFGQAKFSFLDTSADEKKSIWGRIEISEIHVKIKSPVDVPEPFALALLMVGFAVLALKHRTVLT
jgi:hypothetical protein